MRTTPSPDPRTIKGSLSGLLITFYLLSLGLGLIGAGVVHLFAHRLGLLDRPTARSSHHAPTPKGGGIGILASFLVFGAFAGVSAWFWAPLSLLSLVAGYGDRVELPPLFRLAVQAGLIGLMVIGTWLPGFKYGAMPLVLFWVVFIVGTANYYNFMDGIDGIAGASGVVGFSLLAGYILSRNDQAVLGHLSLATASACLGFLPFNMPKAKVFMGDVGSILLGAAFAGIVYRCSDSVLDFLCMSSFLLPFYADEITTSYVRLRDGENLVRPHRRHFYQLLVNENGIAHWKVTCGYAAFQLVVGGSVVLARPLGEAAVAAVMIGWFSVFGLASSRARRREGAG